MLTSSSAFWPTRRVGGLMISVCLFHHCRDYRKNKKHPLQGRIQAICVTWSRKYRSAPLTEHSCGIKTPRCFIVSQLLRMHLQGSRMEDQRCSLPQTGKQSAPGLCPARSASFNTSSDLERPKIRERPAEKQVHIPPHHSVQKRNHSFLRSSFILFQEIVDSTALNEKLFDTPGIH